MPNKLSFEPDDIKEDYIIDKISEMDADVKEHDDDVDSSDLGDSKKNTLG